MGNRTAKFISALVGSIIAGAPLAAVSQNAPSPSSTANAAADCLGSPKGAAPQGQHWYYRLDRATKRQCWYLRAEGGKAAQSAQAAADTPDPDAAAPPSVQNAHAEYIAAQNGTAPSTPNVTAPAPAAASVPPVTPQPQSTIPDNAQQPAVAGRWPDTSTAAASPASQPSPTPATAAAPPSAKPAKSPAPMALAAADSTADKPTGSLQTLMLVIGGALALAGILASVIYRLAGRRVRVQTGDRRVNWDNREPQDHDRGRAPWLKTAPAAAPRAQQPRPVDFDALRPRTPQLAAIDHAIDVVDAREPRARNEAAELDKTEIFDGKFEIEAAPQLAAKEAGNDIDEEAAPHDEDAVDIDVITTMLERLAKEGPRLKQPNPEAALANLARNQRGQSAARA